MPELKRFNIEDPFRDKVSNTWTLIRGTTLTGAQAVLAEGSVRPADWTFNTNLSKSGLPIFGAFGVGAQIDRHAVDMPNWITTHLLDCASKCGKGHQNLLTGCIYKGASEHVAMKAGGNDEAQIKVAHSGVVTISEKYAVFQSRHLNVRFLAVTWNDLTLPPQRRSEPVL